MPLLFLVLGDKMIFSKMQTDSKVVPSHRIDPSEFTPKILSRMYPAEKWPGSLIVMERLEESIGKNHYEAEECVFSLKIC